ncbi:MAG: flagellar motor switch protein FliG [bacterium]
MSNYYRGVRSMGMGESLNGLKKAALFMVALGEEASSEIMKHLDEDEIQDLGKEISLLSNVEPKAAEEVMSEFQQMATAHEYIARGGIEYAKKVLLKSLGPEQARKIIDRLQKSLETTSGFQALRKVDPNQLSKFIQSEHPQTIALVMAHLDTSQAAEAFAALPEKIRAEVAIRMANLKEISPEVIKRVSQVLEERLESMTSYNVANLGGVAPLAEIINRMDRSVGKLILEQIEQDDPDLAAAVKSNMFVFDDILYMVDDTGIREILKRVDNKVLTLALKGTNEELQKKFFNNMSKRAVEMVKEEMEFMGPVRIKDVDQAQQEVTDVARKLEEEGIIVIGQAADEFIV